MVMVMKMVVMGLWWWLHEEEVFAASEVAVSCLLGSLVEWDGHGLVVVVIEMEMVVVVMGVRRLIASMNPILNNKQNQ